MDRSRCEPSHFYCGSSQSLLSRNYRGGAENHYADKTNWRKMLTNNVEQIDLVAERLKVENLIPTEVQEYFYSKK
jgi:hypothetical protein